MIANCEFNLSPKEIATETFGPGSIKATFQRDQASTSTPTTGLWLPRLDPWYLNLQSPSQMRPPLKKKPFHFRSCACTVALISGILVTVGIGSRGLSQQPRPEPEGKPRTIDFGIVGIDTPEPPAPPAPAPTTAQPEPSEPGRETTIDTTPGSQPPMGLAASFVGQGTLKGIPFTWNGAAGGWRSFAPFTQGAEAPAPGSLDRLEANLHAEGILLPVFHLMLDDQKHLIIGIDTANAPATAQAPAPVPFPKSDPWESIPAVVRGRGGWQTTFRWDPAEKGWVSDQRLGTKFASASTWAETVSGWLDASGFPRGGQFNIGQDGRVVVIPPEKGARQSYPAQPTAVQAPVPPQTEQPTPRRNPSAIRIEFPNGN